MTHVTTDGQIEFLDVVSGAPDGLDDGSAEATVVATTSLWRRLVLVVVLVAGGWLIISTGPDPVDQPAFVAPVFDAWPNPPRERDPNVARSPGPAQVPAELSAASFSSTTIVYINTAGRPTVVSLETGDVSEVEVAATRVHETFGVLDDQVVPLSGAAAEQAIVFHTYRDVDRPGVGTMSDRRGVGLGPELCLSGATCARPGQGLERVERGDLMAERFDPLRHPQLADLLDSWESVDGGLLGPDDLRIPEPVGSIWVISPTAGASASSGGSP